MRTVRHLPLLLALAVAGTASAAGFRRTLVLDDAAGGVESNFGVALAPAPGDGVVVGAPGGDSGSAQLFEALSGDLRAVIPPPGDSSAFGVSVASTASDVLVGDPRVSLDDGGTLVGAVYRFDGAGALLGTFTSPTPGSGGAFGHRIAVRGAGELLALDTAAIDRFDVAGGGLVGTVPAPPGATADFGEAIAGDAVAIYAGDPGAERVSMLDPATGAVLRTFTPPPGAAATRFGTALAFLDGDLLVGAPVGMGAVFRFDPTSGALRATYANPLATPGIGFGRALAVLDGALVVGAPALNRAESGLADGAAFVLAGDGAVVALLTRQTPDFLDAFGFALATAAGQVFAGIPHEDAAQVEAFGLDCGGAATCDARAAGLVLRSARRTGDAVKARALFETTPSEFAALRAGGEFCLQGDDGPLGCVSWDDSVCVGGGTGFRCDTGEGRLSARRNHHGRTRAMLIMPALEPTAPAPPQLVLRLAVADDDGHDVIRAGASRRCRTRSGDTRCR